MLALNTLHFGLEKNNILNKLIDIKSACKKKENPNFPSINRAIGALPYLSRVDPWFEFLGHVSYIEREHNQL